MTAARGALAVRCGFWRRSSSVTCACSTTSASSSRRAERCRRAPRDSRTSTSSRRRSTSSPNTASWASRVDTVAARAGVSKATIYRHWGSRAQLIHAAISSLEGPYVETPGNSLREDLAILLSHLVEYFDRPDIVRDLPVVHRRRRARSRTRGTPQQTMQGARASFEQVVHRGIERGELPADVDVGLFVDVVRAPFIYRRVVARVTGASRRTSTPSSTSCSARSAEYPTERKDHARST